MDAGNNISLQRPSTYMLIAYEPHKALSHAHAEEGDEEEERGDSCASDGEARRGITLGALPDSGAPALDAARVRRLSAYLGDGLALGRRIMTPIADPVAIGAGGSVGSGGARASSLESPPWDAAGDWTGVDRLSRSADARAFGARFGTASSHSSGRRACFPACLIASASASDPPCSDPACLIE